MKNTPLSILACACLIMSAFFCGIYLGRNTGNQNIQTVVLFTEPATQTEQTNADSTSQSGTAAATTPVLPTTSGKININTADLATLMTLDGIGEVYAQRIIDYRNEHGPFSDIVDITNVPGIGTKRFEAIMDKITVGG